MLSKIPQTICSIYNIVELLLIFKIKTSSENNYNLTIFILVLISLLNPYLLLSIISLTISSYPGHGYPA